MKQYIALQDMPFWKKGEVKEYDKGDGILRIKTLDDLVVVYMMPELNQIIKDGWIAEYEPKKYTIEQIERAWDNAYPLYANKSILIKELEKL